MARCALTDGERADDRRVPDGLFRRLRTGAPGQVLGTSPFGDRAHDSEARRARFADGGPWATAKPMPDRKEVPAFTAFLHERRTVIERFSSRIEHVRAIATRGDGAPDNLLAGVKLVFRRATLTP